MIQSLALSQLPDFVIDEATIPEALPEVPAKSCDAIEESEHEEIADAEVGERAKIPRQFVVFIFQSSLRSSLPINHNPCLLHQN